MASAWRNSWGNSWGAGITPPVVVQPIDGVAGYVIPPDRVIHARATGSTHITSQVQCVATVLETPAEKVQRGIRKRNPLSEGCIAGYSKARHVCTVQAVAQVHSAAGSVQARTQAHSLGKVQGVLDDPELEEFLYMLAVANHGGMRQHSNTHTGGHNEM